MGCGASNQKKVQTRREYNEANQTKKRKSKPEYEDHSDWVPMTADNSVNTGQSAETKGTTTSDDAGGAADSANNNTNANANHTAAAAAAGDEKPKGSRRHSGVGGSSYGSSTSGKLKKIALENGSWSFEMAQYGEAKLVLEKAEGAVVESRRESTTQQQQLAASTDDTNSSAAAAANNTTRKDSKTLDASHNSNSSNGGTSGGGVYAKPIINIDPLAYVNVEFMSWMHPRANVVAVVEWNATTAADAAATTPTNHSSTAGGSKKPHAATSSPAVKVPLYLTVTVAEDCGVALVDMAKKRERKEVISPQSAANNGKEFEEYMPTHEGPPPASTLGAELAALVSADLSCDERLVTELNLLSGDDGATWTPSIVDKQRTPSEDAKVAEAVALLLSALGKNLALLSRGLKKPSVHEDDVEEEEDEAEAEAPNAATVDGNGSPDGPIPTAKGVDGDATPVVAAPAPAKAKPAIELEPNDVFMNGVAKVITRNRNKHGLTAQQWMQLAPPTPKM